MKSLIRFFVNKPLLVNLLTVFILVVGFLSLRGLNRESYPNVDRKRIYINTVFHGASPSEVEMGVTIPLEEALDGIDGIKEYSSVSVENFSRIKIILDEELKNVENVKNDIRRAIDRVELPDDAKRPIIREWKVSAFPILELGLFSDRLSYAQLRTRAKDLEKKLRRLQSVSEIEEKGILDREVKIELNPKALDKYYLSIEEVIKAIQEQNIEITGGTLYSKKYDKVITVFSKFQSLNDVKNIIIRSTFEGTKIYLKDVATVRNGFKRETTKVRFNGQKGISLFPHKKETADIITTTDEIKKVVNEYKKTLPKDEIQFVYLWTMDEQTKRRLKIVNSNALIGLTLVVLVLIFFMHFKNALWTALGIPVSIAFAMIFLKFLGVTLNSVSLLGFIVVMGMVVDDAIVISENIYRHKLNGLSWNNASIVGAQEVALPVITTVMTTIVAFIPLYFVKGIIGDFAKDIPLVVILVLTGSLFEALFVLPNHIAHSFKRSHIHTKKLQEKKFIIKLRQKYSKLLKFFLNHNVITIFIFVLLFFLAVFVLFSGKVLKYIDFPSEESTAIYLSGSIKNGQNLNYTSSKIKPIEQRLSQYPKSIVKSFSVDIGSSGYPEKFNFVINLTPNDKRKIKADSIITNLKSLIAFENCYTNVVFQKETGGPPIGRAIVVRIVGNNNEKRKKITSEIVQFLSTISAIKDLTRSDETKKMEIKILVNKEKANQLGCSPSSIGNTIRAAFNGVVATTVQHPDELLGYRVILEEKEKNKLSVLKNLKVLNSQGKLIPLSRLVLFKNGKIANEISHFNGDRSTIVSSDLDKKLLTPKEVAKKLRKLFKTLEAQNPGFQFYLGGEAKQSGETVQSMINAAIVAVMLIFFILIMLFRSLPQSFLVLMAIPFSFIGVALALLIHNMVLSAMALFGMVGLAGVVVNDSLVMVDYINQLRKKNPEMSIKQLIIKGASTRLRPVLLTTITTVAGLLPTAYGLGGRDMMIIPTTIVIAWGLLFSTTLTLFLIPSLYFAHIQIHQFFAKIIKNGLKKKIIKFVVFLCLFFGYQMNAEILTLHRFISLSTVSNPEIFKELENIKLSDSAILQTKRIYDITFNAHYYYNYDKPFSDYSADNIKETKSHNYGGSLAMRLPVLGTKTEVGVEYYKNFITVPSSVPFLGDITSEYYNPVLFVNLTQPLLRNWFGIIDSFPLKQAKLNKLIMKYTVDESIEQIKLNLYQLYIDWYGAYKKVQIYKKNVQNSQKLLEQIQKKYNMGLSDKGELSKIKIMNIEYQKGWDYYKVEFDNLSYKIQQWIKVDENFVPESQLHITDTTNFVLSVSNVRQMKILLLSQKLLAKEKFIQQNKLLPDLNFVLSYKTKNYTDDKKDILNEFDYKDYTYGLSLSYPIGGNKVDKGKLKEVKAKLQQWAYDVENFQRNYQFNSRHLLDLFHLYKARLKQDQFIITESKIQLMEEEKKYRQGRSDLFFVIQNRNDLLKYQLTYLQDELMLHNIIIQLLNLST